MEVFIAFYLVAGVGFLLGVLPGRIRSLRFQDPVNLLVACFVTVAAWPLVAFQLIEREAR